MIVIDSLYTCKYVHVQSIIMYMYMYYTCRQLIIIPHGSNGSITERNLEGVAQDLTMVAG